MLRADAALAFSHRMGAKVFSMESRNESLFLHLAPTAEPERLLQTDVSALALRAASASLLRPAHAGPETQPRIMQEHLCVAKWVFWIVLMAF